MEKYKSYIIAFLAFCVLSSKNIIIYNEEILVGLSFLAFIIFIIHYYGNVIQESLNERSIIIKSELQNLGMGKLDSLNELFKEDHKLSLLTTKLTKVINFTINELLSTIFQGKYALNSVFRQQTDQKLKTLSLSKLAIQDRLQQFMADDLLNLVFLFFQRSKKGKRPLL